MGSEDPGQKDATLWGQADAARERLHVSSGVAPGDRMVHGGREGVCREVFVGFGSNVGGPVAKVREAVDRLAHLPGIKVIRVSSLYRTEPVGLEEQDWFVNGVAHIESGLGPRELMRGLLAVEHGMGRTRTIQGGPRVIDLDILLFGDLVMEEPDLRIPHPRLHERRFVLVPLCEVAPHALHPVLNKEVGDILSGLQDAKSVLFLEPWGDDPCGFVGRSW